MYSEDPASCVRIMLVEDQTDFRQLLVALLSRQPDLEVVAEAGSIAEARHRALAASVDVAVLDLGLPDGIGTDLIPVLRGSTPDVAVLVMSASLNSRNLKRATEAGADEILDKFATPGEVVGTIRRLGTTDNRKQGSMRL